MLLEKNVFRNMVRRIIYVAKKTKKMLLEPVIGYTRVVFATKYILSFIAAILILALVLLPLVNPVQDNFRITFSSVEEGANGALPTMTNPRFQGVDDDDQTYNITADTAVKIDEAALQLNNINADINLRDNSWVALKATTGLFKHKQNSLDLLGAVNLFTHDGYQFYAKSMHINIKDNSAYSGDKVHGSGPIGSITADKFSIYQKGERIVFSGNVNVTIYPDSNKVKR